MKGTSNVESNRSRLLDVFATVDKLLLTPTKFLYFSLLASSVPATCYRTACVRLAEFSTDIAGGGGKES